MALNIFVVSNRHRSGCLSTLISWIVAEAILTTQFSAIVSSSLQMLVCNTNILSKAFGRIDLKSTLKTSRHYYSPQLSDIRSFSILILPWSSEMLRNVKIGHLSTTHTRTNPTTNLPRNNNFGASSSPIPQLIGP